MTDLVGELVEKLAAPVASHLPRGQVARRVDHARRGALTVTSDDRTFRAKKLLVATSPASANELRFDPPLAPSFARSQALAYMEQMVTWQPKFVSAVLNFLASGYALQAGSAPGTVNEVAELATIGATLIELKSSEPSASVME
ncbi:MAG: FAD-dependent oxidoreductase [Pseudomonadota bacterium]